MTGYWRDVGQPGLYLQAHRDLLAGKVDVFDHPGRPVISHWPDRPAARVRGGGVVADSLLSPGCDVAGEVVGSVLGPGVVVEKGARRRATASSWRTAWCAPAPRSAPPILDERCEVLRGARSSVPTPRPGVARDEHVVLVGRDCRIGRGRSRPGPGSSRAPTRRLEQRAVVHVRRRRLHPAQARGSRCWCSRQPGRQPTSIAHWLAAVTW